MNFILKRCDLKSTDCLLFYPDKLDVAPWHLRDDVDLAYFVCREIKIFDAYPDLPHNCMLFLSESVRRLCFSAWRDALLSPGNAFLFDQTFLKKIYNKSMNLYVKHQGVTRGFQAKNIHYITNRDGFWTRLTRSEIVKAFRGEKESSVRLRSAGWRWPAFDRNACDPIFDSGESFEDPGFTCGEERG